LFNIIADTAPNGMVRSWTGILHERSPVTWHNRIFMALQAGEDVSVHRYFLDFV
jgi:hypothetical protein